MVTLTAEQARILAITAEYATEQRLPKTLCWAIVYLESEWNWDAIGDQERAFGALQVRVDVHGRDGSYWSGEEGLRRSLALMMPRWRVAFQTAGDGWTGASNEERAVFLRGFQTAAQGSSVPSMARCREAVRMAESVEGQGVEPVVVKPDIQFVGAHANNFTRGRVTRMFDGSMGTPLWEAIVWHTSGGGASITALDSWFNNPAAQASTTFGIDQQGVIHQYVSLDDTPFAHGRIQNPSWPLLFDNRRPDGTFINPNTWAIGIEHLDGGIPGSVTAAQLDASARLTAWLIETVLMPNAEKTGFAVDRKHIAGHYEIDSVDRPNCPNWSALRWSDQIARVKVLLAGPVTPPGPSMRDAIDAITALAIGLEDVAARAAVQAKSARDAIAKLRG